MRHPCAYMPVNNCPGDLNGKTGPGFQEQNCLNAELQFALRFSIIAGWILIKLCTLMKEEFGYKWHVAQGNLIILYCGNQSQSGICQTCKWLFPQCMILMGNFMPVHYCKCICFFVEAGPHLSGRIISIWHEHVDSRTSWVQRQAIVLNCCPLPIDIWKF